MILRRIARWEWQRGLRCDSGGDTGALGLLGVALGLLLPGLAGAQDAVAERTADLRAAAERVAVLAADWEPDLEVAMQGLVQTLGPNWGLEDYRDLVDIDKSADPMVAFWGMKEPKEMPPPPVSYIGGSCFRIGQPTVRALLATYRFAPGVAEPRIDGQQDERGLFESFGLPEIRLVQFMTNRGAAEELAVATAVLQCSFALPFDRPLTDADWAAVSDGLQTRFADPQFITKRKIVRPMGVAMGEGVLQFGSARDPSMRLVDLSVYQSVNDPSGAPYLGKDGKALESRQIFMDVVVMLLAQGS